jgi:hypothetical protein
VCLAVGPSRAVILPPVAFERSSAIVPQVAPTPSALLPPTPAAVEPAVVSLGAAVGGLPDIDRPSIPVGDLRESAENLMVRALGADPVPVAVSAAIDPSDNVSHPGAPALGSSNSTERRPLYVLTRPYIQSVRLGPVAVALHYILEIGSQFVKAYIAWKATGSMHAAGLWLAYELIKTPPMITAQSLADLGLRYNWKARSVLRDIARTPGVNKIRIVTAGDPTFFGVVVRRLDNTGVVFVNAAAPLPAQVGELGRPVPIADVERRVELSLAVGDREMGLRWRPTVDEILTGKAIPRNVAKEWRDELIAAKGKFSLRPRQDGISNVNFWRTLRVDLHLPLGTENLRLNGVVVGPAVGKLVGLGWVAWARKLMRGPRKLRVMLGWPRRAPAFLLWPRLVRGIPVRTADVEPPGPRPHGMIVAIKRWWLIATLRLVPAKR